MNTHRTLFSPRRIGWVLVGCIMCLAFTGTGTAAQEVTALVGARIWDGTGAEAISDGLMLVRDGRIQYVGERGDVPVPAGATVVNVNGRTIIPGLINTHGHVGGVGGSGRENLTNQLRLYAEYGVTTVNSLGGEGPAAVALRDEQSMTGLDRARVFVAGAAGSPSQSTSSVHRSGSLSHDTTRPAQIRSTRPRPRETGPSYSR